MTKRVIMKRIRSMKCVRWAWAIDKSKVDVDLRGCTTADLRAIADILDQVGKEDGKAGG